MPTDYFNSLMTSERMLARHGFARWPSDTELAAYVFEQVEKYDALFNALGMTATKTNGGKWVAKRTERVAQ